MNRARVNPIYARQERYHRGGEEDVDPRSLELYVKFKSYRSHLKKRLERIRKDGRDRELQDEVEDIKFYLTVMNDIQADENHGAEAIQSFIDRIHEMIRKNPFSDVSSNSHSNSSNQDEDDESAPRSPSPEGIESLSETTSTARTIPLERETPQYGLGGRRSEEPASSATASQWDLPSLDNSSTFMRRGSFRDIDMRSDISQPMSNARLAGRGSGIINSSYRSPWDTDPVRNDRYEEGNRNSPFGDSRQRDSRYNRLDPMRDPMRDQSAWDDLNGWNQTRRRNAFEPDTDYDNRNRNESRDYGHGGSGRGAGLSQEYSHFGGPNNIGFDRRSHDPSRNLEESFERRPSQLQFERREIPSATNSNTIQFDYNHGGGRNTAQSWSEEPASTSSVTNLNFPNPLLNQPTFPNSYEIPQQAMYANRQMGYQVNQIPQPTVGVGSYTLPMGSTAPNTQMMMGFPMNINHAASAAPQQVIPNINTSSGVLQSPNTIPVRPAANFQISQPITNNRPGLLPTPQIPSTVPTVAPPNRPSFGFRNPNGILSMRPSRPPILSSPNNSSPAQSSNSNLSMSEISKQKAQQCFSQGRGQSSMHPRPRIASNQMVSERDPRLLNRNNVAGSKQSSNGNHTSHTGDAPSSKRSQNDHADDRRSGSSNSSDRVPRDPRSYQRDDRRDRDRSNRTRDRDREGRDRDRDSRDRNSSNTDPKGRSDRDGGSSSSSHDPRHKSRENTRAEKSSTSTQSKTGSSTHTDKLTERNRPSEDSSSSSRRDDSKDRTSKVTSELDADAKRLEEVRNRVRANMVQPKTVKPLVPDNVRLQEIRKKVAKDGYLTLGGKPVPGQKKQTNFEEAISSTNEPSPGKSSHKSSKKDQAQSSKDKETETSGTVETPKKTSTSKNKTKDIADTTKSGGKTKRRRIIVAESDESDTEREQPSGKKTAKSKSKGGTSAANRSDADKTTSEAPPKNTRFRIPKLKRPETLHVSPPPSPVDSATMDDEASSVTLEDPDGLTLETTNLVKAFVRESVPSEAENILNDPEALNEVVRRLKEQVRQMYSDGSSTATKSPVESAPDEVIEVPSQSPVRDDAADSVVEPGSHRSRSTVRKKNTKRRSSLEKLHDALKEMRFDTMLPLGPRRCTRGAVEETPNEETSAEKAIPPHEDVEPANISDQQETLPNTTDLEKETESPGTTGSAKRGRKRKRKASVPKISKKKKGPITRAQVAVKAAVQKITDPKKKGASAGFANSGEGRVTRSRTGTIGRNSIVTNIALGKVKVEADYVAPKEEPLEPEDIFTSETFPVEDGFQDIAGSSAPLSDDLHEQVAASSIVHLTMPSFSQDSDEALEESNQTPGYEQNDFQRRSVNPPAKKGTKRRVKEEQISPNKNLNSLSHMDFTYEISDLSLLPDLPKISCVRSLAPNQENDTINSIYSKINPEVGGSTQIRSDNNNSRSSEDRTAPVVESRQIESLSHNQSEPVVPSFPVSKNLSVEDSRMEQKFSDMYPGIFKENHIEVIQIDDSDEEEYEITAHHDYYKAPSPTPSSSEVSSDDEAVLCDLAKVKGRVHLINQEKAFKGEGSSRPKVEAEKTNNFERSGTEKASTSGTATHTTHINSSNLETSTSGQFVEPSELPAIKTEVDGNLSDDSSGTALVDRVRDDSTKVNLEAVNGTLFKDHITSCIFTPENKTVSCYHCDKRVKTIPHLLEHIKIHGHQKQFCSLCEFKTSMNSELTRHMKTHHKVYNFKLVSIDRGVDEDPDCIVLPKEVAARTLTLDQLQESYAKHADRLVFGPDDIDKLPPRQIFHTLAHCSLCSYSTKVRVNFCRHLQMHKNGKFNNSGDKPIRDPVNPVPCLERQEMMFDKMTNWAGSSHAPKTCGCSSFGGFGHVSIKKFCNRVNGAADNTTVPQFVLEQFRYVCSEEGCGQITTDEYMLRTHMKTLHPNTEIYSCPHCSKNEHTKSDPRNSVSIDKLGNHLKLHGPKLYRCAHCDFINTLPTPMEKHLPDKHPEKKPIHYLIRNLDANGESATRRSSVDDGLSSDKWRCSVCNSKTLFSTYEDAKNHCSVIHRVFGQFVCADCRYSTDSDQLMKDHITKMCENQSSKEGKIFVMWIRTDYAEVAKPDETGVQGPIWKRTPQSVKHIRGIFLEESKEKNKTSADGNKDTPKEPRKSILKVEQSKDDDLISSFIMKCPKCNIYKTKSKKDMIVHLHNEMSYQRYRCTKCGHKFITENSLKGHVTGDHGIPYNQNIGELLPEDPEIEAFVTQCLEQDSSIKAEDSVVADKTDSSKPEGNFKCKHCPQEFQSGHNLKTHLLARHLASNMHVCQYCKQGFWNKKLAFSHHERNHKNMEMKMHHDTALAQTFTPTFWLEEYGVIVKAKEEKKIKKEKEDTIDDSESPIQPKVPLRVYKPKSRTKRRIVFCAHCEYECDNANDLENHMTSHKVADEVVEIPRGQVPESEREKSRDPYDFSGDNISDIRVQGVRSLSTESRRNSQAIASSSGNASGLKKGDIYTIYKCFHCKDNFLTIRATRTHWQKVHSRRPEERCNYYQFQTVLSAHGTTEKKMYNCFVCDQGPFDFSAVIAHHLANHKELPFRISNQTKLICNHCKASFGKLEEMQQHMEKLHQNLPSKYYAMDLQVHDSSDVFDSLGKLIEDSVRFMCMACKCEFSTREEHRDHISSAHSTETVELTAGLKFQSHTLNSKIQVPGSQVQLNSKNSVKYKCPVCEYVTSDKEKMTSEHLTNHLYVYSCPRCPTSFQTLRDAKFHVRHSHGESKVQPNVNEEAVAAFKLLEDVVEEVLGSDFKPKPIGNEMPRLTPNEAVIRNLGAVMIPDQMTKSLVKNTMKSDELLTDYVVGKGVDEITEGSKNPERSVEAGPSSSFVKIRSNSSVKSELSLVSTSPKPCAPTPGIPIVSAQDDDWMENFVNNNPITPELIEIPGVGSDQWGNIDLADYSGITEEDPFMNTNWGWEGKN